MTDPQVPEVNRFCGNPECDKPVGRGRDGQPGRPEGFCTHCGVIPYGYVDKSEWNPAAYWSVNVACLDDLDPAELVAAPVQYYDGRNDNWGNAPAETRHL